MTQQKIEELLYAGQSPQNRAAFQAYVADMKRGKSLIQLRAIRDALAKSPQIRGAWSPRTFTPVRVGGEVFDEIVCNLSYHFNKHGDRYRTIERMTDEARAVFRREGAAAVKVDGVIKIEGKGVYEPNGKIITFY